MRQILNQSFAEIAFGEKVLAIITDSTRDYLNDFLFPLVAQGTHAPMSEAEKQRKIAETCRNLNVRVCRLVRN